MIGKPTVILEKFTGAVGTLVNLYVLGLGLLEDVYLIGQLVDCVLVLLLHGGDLRLVVHLLFLQVPLQFTHLSLSLPVHLNLHKQQSSS